MNPEYTRTSLIVGISGLILQTGCYALVKVLADRARPISQCRLGGYGFIDEAPRLRRKETGSIWQKSWPASLILGLATTPVSTAFLIFCIVGLLAKHCSLYAHVRSAWPS